MSDDRPRIHRWDRRPYEEVPPWDPTEIERGDHLPEELRKKRDELNADYENFIYSDEPRMESACFPDGIDK